MNNIIKHLEIGNFKLGSTSFPADILTTFRENEKDALHDLCKKVLESDVGSRIAKNIDLTEKGFAGAVVFSKKKGLRLRVNGEEHFVATADEVYQGKVEGLAEIKKIRAAAERMGLVPLRSTDEKTRKLFEKVMAERKAVSEAPSLLGRACTHIKNLSNEERGLKNVAAIFSTSSAVALGGLILFLGGLSEIKIGHEDMVSALRHNNNMEKFFLSCSTVMVGITTAATAVLVVMEKVAEVAHHILKAAAAGAALPITAFILYGSSFIAAIYKLYVQWKFSSELEEILGDGTDPAKRKEALVWLKQNTQLSDLEMKEHVTEETRLALLHEKWEKFTLRVGSAFAEERLHPDKLDFEKISDADAKNLIEDILESNRTEKKLTRLSILANFLGLIATVIYTLTVGHIGSIVTSVLFVLAAIFSLFVDCPKLRKEISAMFDRGVEWIKENRLKILELFVSYLDINPDLKKVILASISRLKNGGQKSEESLEQEGCSETSSTISSTTLDQSEDSRQTQSRLTDETSNHSRAS